MHGMRGRLGNRLDAPQPIDDSQRLLLQVALHAPLAWRPKLALHHPHTMKNIMAKLFGSAKDQAQPGMPSAFGHGPDNPPTIEDGSENATRRQLVQVLFRDVMRKSGIPSQWITCEMLLVSSRTKGHGMYVRLIVRQWDDRLMHYLYAVQKEFLDDIERFEPESSRWLHGLSWQFEVEASCAHTRLPPKAFWAEPDRTASKTQRPSAPLASASAPVPVPTPVPALASAADASAHEAASDLEQLFAIRDHALGKPAASSVMLAGYEETQPSSL